MDTRRRLQWKATRAALVIIAGLMVAALASWVTADDGRRMDGWYAYDYREGLDVEPAVNVFREATEVDGAVWVGHRRWSIDDPESPPSVLALVRYDEWDVSKGYVDTSKSYGDDLTDTTVCFDLRGDELDLNGGHVTFWVMSSKVGQRWHHTVPLEITDGQWTSQQVDTGGEWHNSWIWSPDESPDLETALAHANSYGVAFVGFGDEEPTGRLGMRDFRIGC